MAMLPARINSSDMTMDKMGRSMKKRENMRAPFSAPPQPAVARPLPRPGAPGPRAVLSSCRGDDALAGFQARCDDDLLADCHMLGDLPLPGFHLPVDDIHRGALLVVKTACRG